METRPALVLLVVSATIAPLPACASVGTASAPRQSVRGRTIAIDPGHNGQNWRHLAEINRLVNAGTLRKPCDTTGTATAAGYTEAAYNLDVARRLAAILRAEGARVVLTRHEQRLGAVYHDTRRDRQPGARRRRDLDPRRRRPPSGRGFHVIYPPSIRGLTDDIAAASYALARDISGGVQSGHRDAVRQLHRSRRARPPLRSRRPQPLGRAEGVHRDGKHAQRQGCGAARGSSLPGA